MVLALVGDSTMTSAPRPGRARRCRGSRRLGLGGSRLRLRGRRGGLGRRRGSWPPWPRLGLAGSSPIAFATCRHVWSVISGLTAWSISGTAKKGWRLAGARRQATSRCTDIRICTGSAVPTASAHHPPCFRASSRTPAATCLQIALRRHLKISELVERFPGLQQLPHPLHRVRTRQERPGLALLGPLGGGARQALQIDQESELPGRRRMLARLGRPAAARDDDARAPPRLRPRAPPSCSISRNRGSPTMPKICSTGIPISRTSSESMSNSGRRAALGHQAADRALPAPGKPDEHEWRGISPPPASLRRSVQRAPERRDVAVVVPPHLAQRVAAELLQHRVGQHQRHHRLGDDAQRGHGGDVGALALRVGRLRRRRGPPWAAATSAWRSASSPPGQPPARRW